MAWHGLFLSLFFCARVCVCLHRRATKDLRALADEEAGLDLKVNKDYR